MGRLARFIHFFTDNEPYKGVPGDYTEIKGITYDGNVYYEIGDLKLTGADTLRFSFSATAACNVIGCYTTMDAQTNFSVYASTSDGAKYLRYDGGTYYSYITTNKKYNIVITPMGATGFEQESTWTKKDFTAVSDLCIGTTSTTATSAKLKGTLYGKVVVDGRFDGIPCKRNSDNAIGYYDTVSKTFYENEGTGTPVEYT